MDCLLRNRKVLLSSTNQVLPFSASAVILPPPPRKSLSLGFVCPYYIRIISVLYLYYIHIISVGRSYLNVPLVVYYLCYASTLPTYLGTLAV